MLLIEADKPTKPYRIRPKEDRLMKDAVRANRGIALPKIEEKPCKHHKRNAGDQYQFESPAAHHSTIAISGQMNKYISRQSIALARSETGASS